MRASGEPSSGPGGEWRLASLLDAIGEGYFEMDSGARFTMVSETLANLVGRSVNTLLGKNACDLALPETGAEVRRVLERALLTGGTPQPVVCGVVHGDGKVSQMEISAALTLDEDGRPSGFRGVFRDVTDRDRAQAMTRATLDSQQTQICVLDEKGVIRVVNRAWDFDAGTCGPSAGFEVGGSYLTVLEGHRQSGNGAAAKEFEGVHAVLGGRRNNFSLEYHQPGPVKPRWYNLTATPLLIAGKVSGAVLSRRDITERKLAEEELTTLYKAMDSSIDGLALFAAGGDILFMNPAFAHLFGCDAPVELAGKGLRDLFPPEDLSRLDSETIPHLRRLGYWLGELKGLLKGGGTVHLEVAFTLIEKGQVTICSARDVSDRRRTENALRESERKFRAIFEGVFEGILVLEPSGSRVLAANPTALRMFGYPPDVDRSPIDLARHIPPENRSLILERIAYAAGSGEHLPLQVQMLRADGARFWIEAIGTPTEFDGAPAALVAVSDVTARVASEAALRESEFKFRSIFDTVQEAIIAVDVAMGMKIVAANRACLDMFGYPPGTRPDELSVNRHIGEQDAADIAGHFQHMLTDEPHARTRYRVFRKDGSPFWIEARGSNTEFGGRPVALVAMSDITATVESEAAVRRSELLLRLVIESARDIIFIKDRDRRYMTINPAGAAVFGMTPNLVVGLRDEDLFDPAGAAAAALSDAKVLAGNIVEEETVRTPIGGEERIFHSFKAPLRDEEGDIFGICCIARDTTERKQTEAIIRDSEEKMRLLVEGARDFYFYIADKDQHYTYISPGNFEAITGYTPEEVQGVHVPVQTDNPINTVGNELTRRMLEEGIQPPPYLYEIRHRDGHHILLETYERPIFKEGAIVGLQGIAHDVTERERIHAELRRKDKLLEAVAEAARVMMGAHDSPGTIGVALAILGRAAEVDRVYLYQIHKGGENGEEVLSQRYEWTSGRVQPQISNPLYQSISLSHPLARSWRPILEKGGCVRQVVRNLPEAAQAIFKANGGRSLLVVPIFRRGRLWGCLGFNDCTTEREWTRSDEAILSAFATCVGGGLPEG